MASILIAEDSTTQAERLRHTLASAYPGMEVFVARNGAEVLEFSDLGRLDLIVSDVVMPVMDGYAMCAALKQEPSLRHVPIMLLTSLADPEDIIRGLNAGTDYYLTKPYEDDFLVQKVGAILRQPRGAESNGNSSWKVNFAGGEHVVHAELQQMLNLLLSTYENAVQQNRKLLTLQDALQRANESLEERVQDRTRELTQANEQLQVEVCERQHAEVRLQRQLSRLDALRHIDTAITSSLDLRVTLNVLLDQVTSQLNVDAARVLLFKSSPPSLEVGVRRGFQTRENGFDSLACMRGPAGRAIRERIIVRAGAAGGNGSHALPADSCRAEGFIFYRAVPLIAKGHVNGVLEIYNRNTIYETDEWLAFLQTLAGQAAIAIDGALMFEDLQQSNSDLLAAYETTLEGWSRALDLRDKETEGHSSRVAEMTELLARKLGVTDSDLLHMHRGALLHDIGKLGVPDAILRKPGPLTTDERQVMEQHTNYAYDWLSPIAFLKPALDIPYSHHEKWDGTGYPLGIKGPRIPQAARIFAVADVWDALRSERPYRKAWRRQQCMDHIATLRGSHFDPVVVDAFVALCAEMGEAIDRLPD